MNREVSANVILDNCKSVRIKDKIFSKDHVTITLSVFENEAPKVFTELTEFKANAKFYEGDIYLPTIENTLIEKVNDNTIKLELSGEYTAVNIPNALVLQFVCGSESEGFFSLPPVVLKISVTDFDPEVAIEEAKLLLTEDNLGIIVTETSSIIMFK